MKSVADLADVVDETTLQSMKDMASGNVNHPVDVAAVAEQVQADGPRARGRRANRASVVGPLSSKAMGEINASANVSVALVTATRYVAGIKSLVRAELDVELSQKVLGGFVAQFDAANEDGRLEIVKAYGPLTEDVTKDEARVIKITRYHLAYALFNGDAAIMAKPAADKQSNGEQRLTNWIRAFRVAGEIAAKVAVQAATIKAAEQGHVRAEAKAADVAAEKPKVTGAPRSALGAFESLYTGIGKLPLEVAKKTEYRQVVIALFADMVFDAKKLNERIDKIIAVEATGK